MLSIPVLITVSDPWELGEDLGWRSIKGRLFKIEPDDSGGKALIELEQAIRHKGQTCTLLLAAPRHEGVDMASLKNSASIICSFLGISVQNLEPNEVMEAAIKTAKRWRGGGVAFIGDIESIVSGRV